MEIWKTLRVFHIPTPPATTANYFLTKRYTNIPRGTKDRSAQERSPTPPIQFVPDGLDEPASCELRTPLAIDVWPTEFVPPWMMARPPATGDPADMVQKPW